MTAKWYGALLVMWALVVSPPAAHTANAAVLTGSVSLAPNEVSQAPDPLTLTVRVMGTDISSSLTLNGSTGFYDFTLNDVSTGQISLILDETGDWYTALSKVKNLNVTGDVGGIVFTPAYKWKLTNMPPGHGVDPYAEWKGQFVSEQVGYILYRVRAGVDPERMELWKTTDGGSSWSNAYIWIWNTDSWDAGLRYPDRSLNFWFVNANLGFVVATGICSPCGDCGVGVFRTTDGGSNWGLIETFPRPDDTSYDRRPQLWTSIDGSSLIAAGGTGCNVQGYGSGFYDVIWESNDAGAS